ncbi:MAG: hypothetical protein LBV74_03560 [Tannerella sp.]|jgi:predicted DNA binding CopG/RHH family protein|nr:hypothetical protein [Tannerella sp.]
MIANSMEDKEKDKTNLSAETIRRGRQKKEIEKLSCSINLKLTAEDFKTIREKAQETGYESNTICS